jgi:hypothetical protein
MSRERVLTDKQWAGLGRRCGSGTSRSTVPGTGSTPASWPRPTSLATWTGRSRWTPRSTVHQHATTLSRVEESAGRRTKRPQGVAVDRSGRGRPRTRPEAVIGDRAYSSRAIRADLRSRGIRAVIPQPSDQIAHRKRRGSARPTGDTLGRRHLRTRRAAASQRDVSVRSGQGKEEYALLAILSVERTGRLRQDPGRAAESPAETRTYGDGGGLWPNVRWW